MPQRFRFASVRWFRLPLKVVLIATAVFALMSIMPSLTDGTGPEQRRALIGLLAVIGFVSLGAALSAGLADSIIEIDDAALAVRFESFMHITVPLAAIAAVRAVDPQPRWRYRFGLSTDWRERISCSHGASMVELELSEPVNVKLWPRAVAMHRLWLGVEERDAFIDALQVRIAALGRRDSARHEQRRAA